MVVQCTPYIYHSGVKGMKWGERRYQYKDGTRTPLGKLRRRNESKGSSSSSKTKSSGKSKSVEIKPKSKTTYQKVKSMSDTELRERKARLQDEAIVLDLEKKVSSYDVKKVSLGKKIVNSAMKDVVAPAIRDSGKRLLTDYITQTGAKALGLKVSNDKPNEKKKDKK